MDINEKLDLIINLLTELSVRQDESDEKYEELRESISNLAVGGRGYSIFDADEG